MALYAIHTRGYEGGVPVSEGDTLTKNDGTVVVVKNIKTYAANAYAQGQDACIVADIETEQGLLEDQILEPANWGFELQEY